MITIYHNPRCSKSRETLKLLNENGIEPTIVLYLDTPPDPKTLKSLLKKLNMKAHELIRKNEADYKSLGLNSDSISEDALIEAMSAHPKLIERPIVIHGKKAAIGRPPETVLDIL